MVIVNLNKGHTSSSVGSVFAPYVGDRGFEQQMESGQDFKLCIEVFLPNARHIELNARNKP